MNANTWTFEPGRQDGDAPQILLDTPVLDTHATVHATRDLIARIVLQRVMTTNVECTKVVVKELKGGFSGSVVLLVKSSSNDGKKQLSRTSLYALPHAHKRYLSWIVCVCVCESPVTFFLLHSACVCVSSSNHLQV